jgi:proteasome lid subunit RPN8/RPN11
MTQETIELTTEHLAALKRAKELAYPHECCGVLLGIQDGTRLIVHRVLNTLNAVSTVGGFAIPDYEMRRVRVLAQQENLSIIAVFHSHPSGSTELSSSDQTALSYSEWPWVVVTQDPKTREVLLTINEFTAHR